jgi:hypothetical protein
MSYPEHLDFKLEEPRYDPLSDQIFDVLRDALQPDSEARLESSTQQIAALLPDREPYSNELGALLETCYEIAEQIPFSHPSMAKLVTLIYSCLGTIWQSQGVKAGVSTDTELLKR